MRLLGKEDYPGIDDDQVQEGFEVEADSQVKEDYHDKVDCQVKEDDEQPEQKIEAVKVTIPHYMLPLKRPESPEKPSKHSNVASGILAKTVGLSSRRSIDFHGSKVSGSEGGQSPRPN